MNVGVKPHQGLEEEKTNFIHLILEALGEGRGFLSSHNAPFLGIDLSTFGCQPWSELWQRASPFLSVLIYTVGQELREPVLPGVLLEP